MRSHTEAAPPTPQLARALIRSLTRGTAISQGVRFIHVGHDRWIKAQIELLTEIAEDGQSDTKFVRGAYGAGKSHFLSLIQDLAREREWLTSHIECKVDKVQIDRFETLYPWIVEKLLSKRILEAAGDAPNNGGVEPVRHLLERWAQEQFRAVRIRLDGLTRPFDADARLYAHFQAGLLQGTLPPAFAQAMVAFGRAHLDGDFETTAAICRWLRGAEGKIKIPSMYLQKNRTGREVHSSFLELHPIGKGTAHDAMRGLLWLIRSSGYSGLVLCIDEVEELAKLGNRKRQDQALQALREYVDHAGGDGGYSNLCMYLAATPEMFESEHFFPRYDALATRIQSLGQAINWRAPVIDLDRTPLDPSEMREMALRIWRVHSVAYPSRDAIREPTSLIDQLLGGLGRSRFRVAKPRLLARVLVDELERLRQSDGSIDVEATDLDKAIAKVASESSLESPQ